MELGGFKGVNRETLDGFQKVVQFVLDALADTPVAVLTSSDSPSDRRDVESLGADRYIKKPLTLPEFMAIGGVLKDLVFKPQD